MTLRSTGGMILKAGALALFAFILIGPLLNLALWSVAERWYAPFKLPVTYGLRYWEVVFRPTGDAMASLATSVFIAVLVVIVALAVSVPAGYALARLKLPLRAAIMIAFLLPQAFPSITIYINVARIFYSINLAGTVTGVVLVHAAHALVYSVWITTAAFAAVDRDLELAARHIARTLGIALCGVRVKHFKALFEAGEHLVMQMRLDGDARWQREIRQIVLAERHLQIAALRNA